MFKKVTPKQELRIKVSADTRSALDTLLADAKNEGYEVDTDGIFEEALKHAIDKAQKQLNKLAQPRHHVASAPSGDDQSEAAE